MRNIIKQSLFISGMLVLLAESVTAAPVFTPDSQPTGWVSRPVVTIFDLSSGVENFYQLDYRKDTWAGNVLAKHVNSTARVQTTGPWDAFDPTITTAASLLDAANYSTGRKIVTNGDAFRWTSLNAAERAALGSEDILDFLRGDRSNEDPLGNLYRSRESIFGDVLHSNIYYWNDGVNETLYVGANDGMLHSIDAATGAENFAYIPSMLIPKLNKLTDLPYVPTHFVDGPISIANLDVSGTKKTILVGGLGAGGAGLYALDVTSAKPSSETIAADMVLWEITATGAFANLGHTYGTPALTRLRDGTPAVIIGNGYVNSGNGHAVLYVINAVTGALIVAIDTQSGSTASPNGLSSPAIYDVDGDGRPEYAYAGDIDGNLWKFNLIDNTSSLVMTTSPVQAITSAPVVRPHPYGGQMIDFATGRILTSGDEEDSSVHYAYGIWDGAPVSNTGIVTQTLTASTFSNGGVRTVTNNLMDWSAGSGHSKGWKVAFPPGERVVGEMPFYNSGRFYFLTTNPTIGNGENWLNELVFNTGGSPLGPIFDLSEDGNFNSLDLAVNGGIPVSKYLGDGVFSQPLLVKADGLITTLYAFHPNLPISEGVPTPPDDPGVSGGHFDFDIYYYDDNITTTTSSFPVDDVAVGTICKKTRDIEKEYDKIANKICIENTNIPDGYVYLTDYNVGSICKADKNTDNVEYNQKVTCAKVETRTITAADYLKVKHEHEYDDKYDVTGVNMLNPSLIDFIFSNAIVDATKPFKILVMNQYLNPAVTLSVGGADFENVKTYGSLASEPNPTILLMGLPIYTRDNIATFIYNLPLDAFKSQDWWGDGSIRAGLIPTQTGCVNKVKSDGSMLNNVKDKGGNGILGLNGERFDGAFTIQVIKADTPPGHLEWNGLDVSYGWRVKQANFSEHVLAEYTSFWHHPNKYCYGNDAWIPDPPEDFDSDSKTKVAAVGSADPKDGVFGAGLAVIDITTTVSVDGLVSTTVYTYSDDTTYTRTVTQNNNDSITTRSVFRDGTEETVISYVGGGGVAGFIDPNTGSPEEELSTGVIGRQTWRDLVD
jgi:hypothetical protein